MSGFLPNLIWRCGETKTRCYMCLLNCKMFMYRRCCRSNTDQKPEASTTKVEKAQQAQVVAGVDTRSSCDPVLLLRRHSGAATCLARRKSSWNRQSAITRHPQKSEDRAHELNGKRARLQRGGTAGDGGYEGNRQAQPRLVSDFCRHLA